MRLWSISIMDEIFRDIRRLETMVDSSLGLEKLSLPVQFGELIQYYLYRFLTNIHHSLRDFSRSEIEDYNHRYKYQLDRTLSDPLLSIDKLILPVPKGMIHPYGKTLSALLDILEEISVRSLLDDVTAVNIAILNNDGKYLPKTKYPSKKFNEDKIKIGSLYSKNGLTHVTGQHAFSSTTEIKPVNLSLIDITKQFYPEVLKINTLVSSIDKEGSEQDISKIDKTKLTASLMDTAYRVSIFAVIMDHIQNMEHAFVKTLDVLRQASMR